jgi:hypothetical protein
MMKCIHVNYEENQRDNNFFIHLFKFIYSRRIYFSFKRTNCSLVYPFLDDICLRLVVGRTTKFLCLFFSRPRKLFFQSFQVNIIPTVKSIIIDYVTAIVNCDWKKKSKMVYVIVFVRLHAARARRDANKINGISHQ